MTPVSVRTDRATLSHAGCGGDLLVCHTLSDPASCTVICLACAAVGDLELTTDPRLN